ncbi:AAA family ATPase [Algoriphagus sp. AGSA1]|uniref:AAA family ATPase n=1 Tax=unclassified Algoriphagus TaxID=2641541 RepID=UPI00177B9F33|nr:MULTISPECIES: AAA family ATPase [unclassified Algoriphagus]MCE7056243.1 AAA family ATPase [Algoriphagus sp. AGSA1]
MKILAIRIKNLASLDGTTEIDFTQEPLQSAGIFAITGPTGAGKSTILDALCLALYARTPRYKLAETGVEIKDVQGSTILQGDVRGILRDGTGEGFAGVDFVGVDGYHYRSTWSVRRARNKADGNLQAYEIALKNTSTNQDIPGRKTELLQEIERLVGLNFEQFTRSVLLAQGDFTAFLKAGRDEKSSLLEKLTGTHVYSEISRHVFEKHREQTQQLRELNVQREGIPTLTSGELDALEVQKEATQSAIKTQEKSVAELGKEITWHEQYVTLQSHLETARLQYEQGAAAKEEALPRERRLQQIIRVQPVRPTVDNLHHTQSLLTDKSTQSEQLITRLAALDQQKETLDLSLQQAESNLNTRIQEQEAAQSLLDAAKKLDTQLTDKETQIRQAEDEVNTALEKLQQHQEKSTQTKQEADQLEKALQQLNQWKEKHASHQPIAEQHQWIISKLSDAETLLDTLQHRSSLMDTAEKEIGHNQQEKERLDIEQASLQASLQQAQQDFDSLQAALSALPIASLVQEKSTIDASVEDAIAAEAHWKLLYSAQTERDTLQQLLKDNKKQLEDNLNQLTATAKSLETTRAQRDTSLSMLEKARLAAAKDVESLRATLEPDEPCPVCGSTTHPYATHNPQLDYVLRQLEASHQEIETDYTQLLTTHSSLNQACEQLQKSIGTQDKDLTFKEKAIQQLEETWTLFKIHTACMKQPVGDRATWLRQQLQQQKDRQHELREQIRDYGTGKEQLEALKNQRDAWDKQLTETDNALKDIERNLKSLQEQFANHTQEQQLANANLDKTQQSLSPYFTSEQWFRHWKTDPEAFIQRIRKFAEEWITNEQQLEEGVRQQGVLTATLKGIQEQGDNFSEAVKLKEQNLSQLQEQWNDLTEKRKTIFDGESISKVEANLKESVTQTRQKLDERRAEKETLQAELTRTITQKEQTEKDISTLKQQETNLEAKIKEWLDAHNRQHATTLTESELILLLNFTQDWIEAERAALRTVDDAVTLTKSVWSERSHTLEKHMQQRLSERSLDELTTLQDEATSTLRQYMQTVNEIGFRLREDASNKQRIGQLLQDIERQSLAVDNWAKLNEIIGSADGKKFRQIAQEYTLDVLLSYANVHLEVLSKRYILQRIPNSLGLQVLDQDMGDEVRTVYSLSGGESFLVSLALALGLASLSSSRMKVESLFIDEGFGSLDPTTLNIAMDALERLHNQGRKVGVISHVQEMTERIPMQIKVSKQQSGRSKVEVLGNI